MDTTKTSKKDAEFRGKFITLRLKIDKPEKWPDVHTLLYKDEYRLIKDCPSPHDPAHKFVAFEFDKALVSFTEHFKRNNSGSPIIFSNENIMKYNVCNGLIAVYTIDRIKIAKVPFIWEEALKVIGYTRDESLPVPFSNGEAYYDRVRDELYAIW